MIELGLVSILSLTVAATLADLNTGRIPNGLIICGIVCGCSWRVIYMGAVGVLVFLGGILFPVLFFGIMYYFRMIGAGDIKLLCMIGGYLGISGCFRCITIAVFTAGLYSVGLMIHRNSIEERLIYFYRYTDRYFKKHQWISYMENTGERDRFCFSVPILMGLIFCIVREMASIL